MTIVKFGISRNAGVLKIILSVLAGTAMGMMILTARVSNALSYLSDSSETCMNCHVMTDAYSGWKRSSHGRVAVCNDCHVPHQNIAAKYAFKGMDGTKHSFIFTMRMEPQVIKLSRMAGPVVQENCLKCHDRQFAMVRLASASERKCWDCHSNVHSHVQSVSASPAVLRPKLPEAGIKGFKQR